MTKERPKGKRTATTRAVAKSIRKVRGHGGVLTSRRQSQVELRVFTGYDDALAAGVHETVARVFASHYESPGCGFEDDGVWFKCLQGDCAKTCKYFSAQNKEGFPNEREEKPRASGVLKIPGRIYWCNCE